MVFHKCSFCNNSYRSNEERKEHEIVCIKNGKGGEERFKAQQELKKKIQTKIIISSKFLQN